MRNNRTWLVRYDCKNYLDNQFNKVSSIKQRTENLWQKLDKVGGLDKGDEGGELLVGSEEVKDVAGLLWAAVQRHRKLEGVPGQHGVGGWTRNLKRQFEFDFEDLRLSGPPIDGIPNFPPNWVSDSGKLFPSARWRDKSRRLLVVNSWLIKSVPCWCFIRCWIAESFG